MELRSHSNLHFIQAIKGSLVIKILNVNARGRPTLTFKKVKHLYEAGDAEHHDSVPRIWSRDEFECFRFGPNEVKSESLCKPCLPRAERTTRLLASEFENSAGDEESKNHLDDLSFANMTLKQFTEMCKVRKRKCATCVDSSKKTFENSFSIKQEYTDSQPEEDGDDLKEPLSHWKSKISKNKKRKRRCIRNHVPTSSQSAILIENPEQFPTDQHLWQPSGNLPAPIDIKVEVNETDYSSCPTMNCVTADSFSHCNEQVDACGVVIDEVHLTARECVLETDLSTSFRKEQPCNVNEASSGYTECASLNSVSDERASGWEIMNVDIPISYQFPDFPVAGFENEGCIIHPLLDDVSPEPISMSKDNKNVIYHNSLSHSSIDHLSWPSSSDSQVQVLDMATDNRLQCMEIIDGDGAYLCEDGTKDDFPSDLGASTINPASDCSSSWSSTSCLGPNSCLVSVADDSPLSEKKQLFFSASADGARNYSAGMHSFDTTDKPPTPAKFGDYHHSELQRPPERLLSTRKSISPTSQERLCKAMNSIELHDDKHSECRGKLLFGKQTENKVVRAEGCNKIRRDEVTINTKQVLRKPKYDKKGSHPRGILKGPHLSSPVPSSGTGGTPTQSLSQSAIAFSQRQMQDIESLATKLTLELSYMKDLVKEMSYSEACPATSLKHTMDKVTMAIKSVNKAEETARRWLSIMARDCNRFCKIMKLTEAGSSASGNVVPKERKITFADEAGGELCHVNVFKDDMTS